MNERPEPLPKCPSYMTTAGSTLKLARGLVCLALMLGVRTFVPPSGDIPEPKRLVAGRAPQPQAAELQKQLNLSPEKIQEMEKAANDPKRLNAPVSPEVLKAEKDLFPSQKSESLGDTWADFKDRIFGYANATKVKSLLKQYQVVQCIYLMEEREGKGALFATMDQLFSPQSGPAIDNKAFFHAWDGSPHPQALQGYFFSEIVEEADEKPLHRESRAGLCAYPEKPSSNSPVILMLLDTSAKNDEDLWHFYTADSRQVSGAVRRWPAEASMGSVWTQLRKYAPKEALAEAQRLAAMAPVSDNPKPVVPYNPDHYRPFLERIRTALQFYRVEKGHFPSEEEGGLKALLNNSDIGFSDQDLLDPWGTPYRYRAFFLPNDKNHEPYAEIKSDGPDHIPGTEDDITIDTVIRMVATP